MTQRWTSDVLALPVDPDAPWARVDLELEDVEHEGPSFAVWLYLNNPDVEESAGDAPDSGFAGRFSVFGHGECWGDEGHCEVPAERVSAFDRRPPHPLEPINVSLEITEAVARLGPDTAEVTVTALAFSMDEKELAEPLRFKRLSLITYD